MNDWMDLCVRNERISCGFGSAGSSWVFDIIARVIVLILGLEDENLVVVTNAEHWNTAHRLIHSTVIAFMIASCDVFSSDV